MKLKKLRSMILTIICIFSIMGSGTIGFADKIPHRMKICDIFPDTRFAELVRKDIGARSIESYVSQWELNFVFYLSYHKINHKEDSSEDFNIEGIQYLNRLKGFSVCEIPVKDLNPIRNLSNLRILWLCGGNLTDLEPLSELMKLKHLYLGENQISDLSPLSRLPKLNRLDIPHNQINDVTPLVPLKQLKLVNLVGNPVTDLEPLNEIPALLVAYTDPHDTNFVNEYKTPGQKENEKSDTFINRLRYYLDV